MKMIYLVFSWKLAYRDMSSAMWLVTTMTNWSLLLRCLFHLTRFCHLQVFALWLRTSIAPMKVS
jgi:hypothetical protein